MKRSSSKAMLLLAIITGSILLGYSNGFSAAPSSFSAATDADILTPQPPAMPRINGPSLFGVRPLSPFLYTIPATGDRPMSFAVEGLPAGLKLDAATGRITGSLEKIGTYPVTLVARNALGENRRTFRIVVGEQIALTPPMGWNSWDNFGTTITETQAKAQDSIASIRFEQKKSLSGLFIAAREKHFCEKENHSNSGKEDSN